MHPFTGLATREDGAVKACCRSHPVGHIEKQSLEAIWNNDTMRRIRSQVLTGERPPECAPCFALEDQGVESLRQRHIKGDIPEARINLYPNALEHLQTEMTMPFEIPTMEIKLNNLCNLKCRMCNPTDSTSWNDWDQVEEFYQKENNYLVKVIQDLNLVRKPYLDKFDNNPNWWDSFEKNLPYFRRVEFAGGEPLLIKQYYDFMDHMIETGANEKTMLELYSNCSVWNPLFIDRLLKFKRARFVMSIDGVDKVAEYNRKGTKWDIVRENVFKFARLPIHQLHYNVAISPYNLLDFTNLAKFLMQVYEINNGLQTRCYSVTVPYPLHWVHLNQDLRGRVINEIDQSLEILAPNNFDILKKELRAIKAHILKTNPEKPELFVEYTKRLDIIRNEKFEDIYGYKLY